MCIGTLRWMKVYISMDLSGIWKLIYYYFQCYIGTYNFHQKVHEVLLKVHQLRGQQVSHQMSICRIHGWQVTENAAEDPPGFVTQDWRYEKSKTGNQWPHKKGLMSSTTFLKKGTSPDVLSPLSQPGDHYFDHMKRVFTMESESESDYWNDITYLIWIHRIVVPLRLIGHVLKQKPTDIVISLLKLIIR